MHVIAISLKLNRQSVTALYLALLFAALPWQPASAADPATAPATSSLPIRTVLIGVSVALTGISAPNAESTVNGARLAIQAANRQNIVIDQHRVQFDLLVQDDRDDNNRALIAARYLDRAGVVAVLGNTGTGASIATAQIYEDAGIAHISPTVNGRAFTQQGFRTAFRITGHDVAACKLLGDYVVHTLHLSKIAIISNGTSFGNSVAQHCGQAFKDNGAEIVLNEMVKTRTSDFNRALSGADKAEAVFFSGFSGQAPAIASAMRRLGSKARLVTALSGVATYDTFFITAAADAEGAIAMENGMPIARLAGIKALREDYQRDFGSALNIYGVFSHDATAALIAAIRQADSLDRRQIVDSLHRISYKGLSGTIGFNADGDMLNPTFTIYEARKGKWAALASYGGK